MLPNSCRGLLLHLALVCGAGGRSWVVESYDGEAAAKKRKGGGEWWTAHRVATVPGAKGADWLCAASPPGTERGRRVRKARPVEW